MTIHSEPAAPAIEHTAKAAHHAGSNAKTDYVVGFRFSPDRHKVVLIRKNKPAWQAGKFNGVGGKVESKDKNPLAAMRREFREETGVDVDAWEHYCTIEHPFARVFYYKSFGEIGQCRTIEGEAIIHMHRSLLDDLPTVSDILWLIPLALNPPLQAKVSIRHSE